MSKASRESGRVIRLRRVLRDPPRVDVIKSFGTVVNIKASLHLQRRVQGFSAPTAASKTLNIPGGGMSKGAKHPSTSSSRQAPPCSSAPTAASKTLNILGGVMSKGPKHPSTSCSRPAPACSSHLQSKTLNIPGGDMSKGAKSPSHTSSQLLVFHPGIDMFSQVKPGSPKKDYVFSIPNIAPDSCTFQEVSPPRPQLAPRGLV